MSHIGHFEENLGARALRTGSRRDSPRRGRSVDMLRVSELSSKRPVLRRSATLKLLGDYFTEQQKSTSPESRLLQHDSSKSRLQHKGIWRYVSAPVETGKDTRSRSVEISAHSSSTKSRLQHDSSKESGDIRYVSAPGESGKNYTRSSEVSIPVDTGKDTRSMEISAHVCEDGFDRGWDVGPRFFK